MLEIGKSLFEKDWINEIISQDHIKCIDLGGGLYSIKHSKRLFFSGRWNEINVKARGLFVTDSKTYPNKDGIVLRSYDKFFNIGEKEVTLENLFDNLRFPVQASIKYNGFLGLIGMNKETKELIFTSKSTNKGDFAGWVKEGYDRLDDVFKNKIKEILKSNDVTLIFEVIRIKEDPHIIKYSHDNLTLLDVVENTKELKFRDDLFKELEKINKENPQELLYTKSIREFNEENKQDLLDFIRFIKNSESTEGLVIRDSSGFMIKLKSDYYLYLKKHRSYLRKYISGSSNLTEDDINPKFIDFIKKNTEEIKELSFIEIWNKFKNKECEF